MSLETPKKLKRLLSIFAIAVVVISMGYLTFGRSGGIQTSEIYGEQDETTAIKEGKSISESELVELLKALDSGDVKQFEKLRVENLNQYREYRSSLIPVLKNRALKNFTIRANVSDWKNWSELSNDFQAQNNSDSRTYLNNLQAVNIELGNFLETSALVFHQISQTVGQGVKADLPVIVTGLQESAESLLAHRESGFKDKKDLIDTSIQNETYQKVINQEYAKIVLSYLSAVKTDPLTELKLISFVVGPQNLKEHKLNAELSVVARSALAKSVLSKDILIRNKISSSPEIEKMLIGFAKYDNIFAVSLAGFFEALSLDYIELGELAKASTSFQTAVGLAPGRTSQKVIASLLIKDNQQLLATQSPNGEDRLATTDAPRVREGSSMLGLFFKAILLAGIFMGALIGYRKFHELGFGIAGTERDDGPIKHVDLNLNEDEIFEEDFTIGEKSISQQIASIESPIVGAKGTTELTKDLETIQDDRRKLANDF
jgi:hypothetical protein